MNVRRLFVRRVFGIAVTLLLPSALHASLLIWDADPTTGATIEDGSGTWDTVGTNWSDGVQNLAWNNATPDSALIGNGGTPGTITLGAPVTAAGITFGTLAGGNYLMTGGTLALASGATLTMNTNAVINSSLAAAGGFTVSGIGDLQLGGANSAIAGTLGLNSGRIFFNADTAGSTGATWSIASGATILFNTADTNYHAAQRGAISGPAGATLRAGGTGGPVTFFIGALGDSVYSGGTSNGPSGNLMSIAKTGTGVLTLVGTNIAHGGSNYISSGRMILSNTTAFANGTSPATFNIASGATLEFAVTTGTKTLGSTATNTITGGGTLVKSGAGLLALDEQGGAQYVIQMRMTNGLIDLQGGTLRNGGWTGQQWTDGASWTNKSSLNVGTGTTFDVWDGNSPFFDALTGSGTIDKNSGGGDVRTLTIGANNGSGLFNGTMKNTQTYLALTKNGIGTQTLTGANVTYSGVTTINGGRLVLSNTTGFASGAVSNNAQLLAHLDAGNSLNFANSFTAQAR